MHITIFSPIPYHFLHQRPQKLAEQLAARGIDVTYVQPDGWREYLRGGKRGFARSVLRALAYHVSIGTGIRGSEAGSGAGVPGVTCVTLPLTIPINRRNPMWIDRWNVRIYRRFLEREVVRAPLPSGPTIALVEHPFWGACLQPGDFDAVYYDCIDDLSLFAGRNNLLRYRLFERSLCELSTAAFATAQALGERLRQLEPHLPVHRVPNGVDAERFVRARSGNAVPLDVSGKRRPLVGYIGALYAWLDYELIEYAVRSLPEYSFVFIGPLES